VMFPSSSAFFLVLLSIIFSAKPALWPISEAGEGPGLFIGVFKANLLGQAHFVAYASTGFDFCIAEYLSLPHPTRYSSRNCKYYINGSSMTGPKRLNISSLRAINYSYGFRFRSKKNSTLTGDGATCPARHVSDGKQCQPVRSIQNDTTITLLPKIAAWYSINISYVPAHLKSLRLLANFTVDVVRAPGNYTITSFIRYMGSPTMQNHDFSDFPFIYENPSPGTYNLQILSNATKPVNLTFRITQNYITTDQFKNVDQVQYLNETFQTDEMIYYRIQTKPEQPLWVSVLGKNCTTNPSILVRHNQIPDQLNHEGPKNCNQLYCESTNIIHFEAASYPMDYFVGIQSDSDCTAMVWFNSDCPRDCTIGNRGGCGIKNRTGVCVCRYGWEGPTCREHGGLSRDIVSGIIVSVLVGTAIAFAIMFHWCGSSRLSRL